MTASEKLLQKILVASPLDSRQWNAVDAGLRDRAFFSSQVQSIRFLHDARKMVAERAGGQLSASEIRRDLRKVLKGEGYARSEKDAGTIKDLYSKRRLDTIIKTNVEQARGYVRHLDAMRPGAFAAFPAQELVRVREREHPRDWAKRWRDAGGQLFGGRMIALRDDPIWTRISAFGNPFPPFDFGSGMGVRGVKRREAIALGVVSEDEVREKVEELRATPPPSFNANLATDVQPGEEDYLRAAFGDQIAISGGQAKWRENIVEQMQPGDVATLAGGVKLPFAALSGVPDDMLALVPALLRSDKLTLETVSGQILKAVLDGKTVKGITLT